MSKNYYIIPIFISHQGCPHQCVFCNQDRIAGKYEEVFASDVRNTIEEYLPTFNKGATVEVSFFGGTFTAINVAKQKELLEVAREYKQKGLINKIRLSTRPDAISPYILSYLKEYGVDIIELGVQSLNDEVLRKSGRGHSVEHVEKASKLIKEAGFVLGHQIMPGLPGDNFEIDIESAKKSIAMKPDICRIYPSLVIKDTPMEDMYNRGDYKPYSLDDAVYISGEMLKLYNEAKIKVIRIGLQPTDTITTGKDIVSGPFHPSFRELVEGHLICENLQIKCPNEKDVIIEVNEKDLKIDTYRASGAGGQHINKTESAVRITHLPSGIVVACQDQRSQLQNREKAMRVLRAKLQDQAEQEAISSMAADRKSQVGTGDRSERIRTYNYPQGRVTDHRINLTLYKLDAILNGDLDEIIQALNAADQAAKMQEANTNA